VRLSVYRDGSLNFRYTRSRPAKALCVQRNSPFNPPYRPPFDPYWLCELNDYIYPTTIVIVQMWCVQKDAFPSDRSEHGDSTGTRFILEQEGLDQFRAQTASIAGFSILWSFTRLIT